jgi:hypothetical protein
MSGDARYRILIDAVVDIYMLDPSAGGRAPCTSGRVEW